MKVDEEYQKEQRQRRQGDAQGWPVSGDGQKTSVRDERSIVTCEI